VYGVHGVLFVETVHLFPMMTLSVLDALARVDPSLEEAAQGMDAKGWCRFWDVTLPLTTPGENETLFLCRRFDARQHRRNAGP